MLGCVHKRKRDGCNSGHLAGLFDAKMAIYACRSTTERRPSLAYTENSVTCASVSVVGPLRAGCPGEAWHASQ